jgi:hypothetical protein
MVVATPAYQTAYQSARPGPITQVLRRTLATLSAAVKRGRILADTEEVTGSNPVSPTSITPGQSQISGSQTVHGAGPRDGCLPGGIPSSTARAL